MVDLNSCDRCDNSLKLNMATNPATVCNKINSYGYRRATDEMSTVVINVMNAVRESRKMRIIIGNMANGMI